ncbi:MAG TPA: ATP-binding protein [Blastocatellia bacterium]|nr:ATP-binding protein [Blastocatellia bacterium]
MKKWPIVNLSARHGDSRLAAEPLIRNVLLFGFLILLLLIAGIGYWSRASSIEVEREIAEIHRAESRHLRLIFSISETFNAIITEARTATATKENQFLHFTAKQRLTQLKREMDARIKEVEVTSVSRAPEWGEFLTAFNEYWAAIQSSEYTDWYDERERVAQAIAGLEQWANQEREQNERLAESVSRRARNRLLYATMAVLGVGIAVALLTFYEIRRILDRLGVAYQESRETRDYLQSILDSLVSGVIVIGQDGNIQTIGKAFRRLPGIGAEATVGKNFKSLFKRQPELIESIANSLEGFHQGIRHLGRTQLGDDSLFEVFLSPLVIGDQQRGLIVVFIDVTKAAQAETELRRNRALTAVGQMTAQIAHEIKNPLGSIKFAAEILKRRAEGNGKEEMETIQVIERSVTHLTSIVTELNEFARPKELNRTEVNLNQLLDDLLPMATDRLNAKKMVVKKKYAPDLPTGHYDGTELRKLFLNLIINAIDASDPESSLELRTGVEGDRFLRVDIIDHGAGIDPETLRRLFEPFYTTKKGGTGLGMAIAKKIAELHGGNIGVASALGVGTTVTVKLPRN